MPPVRGAWNLRFVGLLDRDVGTVGVPRFRGVESVKRPLPDRELCFAIRRCYPAREARGPTGPSGSSAQYLSCRHQRR